jgi:autotransporter-associated beta strand protein
LPTATAVTVASNATLDLNGGTQQIGSLSGAGLVTNSASGELASLVVAGSSNTSTTFGGTISDGFGPTELTLNGGTLTLSGTNTYSGGTVVESGSLILDSSAAIKSGSSLTVGNASAFGSILPDNASIAPAAVSIAPVPEPATLGLLAAGMAVGMFVAYGKKYRQRQ